MTTLVAINDIACPRCSSRNRNHIISAKDYIISYPQKFDVVQCKECSLAYTSTQPSFDDLKRVFYPDEYICYSDGSFLTQWRERNKHRKRLNTIAPYVQESGRVLDIGCGTASMLRLFKAETNWDVHGCEPKAELCSLPESHGVVMHPKTLEECNFETASFDAVTMIHVLEHVPDPLKTIQEVSRILKPGGLFLTEQPDFDSATRKIFGEAWWGYHLPRHLQHFDRESLSGILRDAGFSIEKVHAPLRPACIPWSISLRLERMGFPKYIAAIFGNRSPLVVPLFFPVEYFLSMFAHTDVMEIMACKR